jgi:hypothetical protein
MPRRIAANVAKLPELLRARRKTPEPTSGIPRPGAGHRIRGTVLTRQRSTGKSGPLAPRSVVLKHIVRLTLIEQRRAHHLFDVAVAEIPTPAQLGDDAPQKRPARLNWQQVRGGSDDAKLMVRYRDHAAPLVRDAG